MIHPTAIIHKNAEIGQNVSVGAFSIIDADVSLGDNCCIDPHVWIGGMTSIGDNNFIGFGSNIGGNPQDLSFDKNVNSGVIIGSHNTIREHVTIHRSTISNGFTKVGDSNMLMVNTHLAHDVNLGCHNILANSVLIAGHIQVGNFCFLSGGAVFHQFIKIGSYALCQGNAAISKDIPPYCLVHGHNQLAGLNTIGLRRAGFDVEQRKELKDAYKILFNSGMNMRAALTKVDQFNWNDHTIELIAAAKNPSKKGIMMAKSTSKLP